MLTRWFFTCALVALSALCEKPVAAQPSSPASVASIVSTITALREVAHARDSLSAVADTSSGTIQDVLDEQITQLDADFRAGMITAVERIQGDQKRGVDVTAARSLLTAVAQEEWPRYQAQLQKRLQGIAGLTRASDKAAGSERVAMEAEITQRTDRLVQAFEAFVDEVLSLERVGIDASAPRQFLVQGLTAAASGMVTRLQLAGRAHASAVSRLSRDASNADLRYALEAADERLKRTSLTLQTAIQIMDRLHLDTENLRVAYIGATGKLTADVFNGRVLGGLIRAQWAQLLDVLAGKAPQWLFQAGVIVVTFLAFRAIAQLVRATVKRAVGYSHFSELMRGTLVGLAGMAVMLVGLIVILTQLGVQVAPLLAGFGVAGVVVGFAMQSTLSNFAAGGMILGNRPFDLGDEIEVAGVAGHVRHMSLVSTTVVTGDNQTLIIPNSAVWGGVIRNKSTQAHRRVDLTFSIGYGNDIEKAERALREVVAGLENVLKDPAPVIKLHQLADASVLFLVRVWTARTHYDAVIWDLTRAVKLRFDQDGITIPLPQRELHFKVSGKDASAAMGAVGSGS